MNSDFLRRSFALSGECECEVEAPKEFPRHFCCERIFHFPIFFFSPLSSPENRRLAHWCRSLEQGLRNNITDACERHDPCQHGGICISTDSGPLCECRNLEYEGTYCERGKQFIKSNYFASNHGAIVFRLEGAFWSAKLDLCTAARWLHNQAIIIINYWQTI